ncbi:uncharacterized protein LOC109727889 [Ananas comosus]|uniref:Uncharacterized protein LOC109727889 n=1 Tax=Ananas comosus TaxID=4615 RepID=A0A6P5H0X7_ANACO|nr:uncharacterized protein LOC109727889 [Ananas comosus]
MAVIVEELREEEKLRLVSPAFAEGGRLPRHYTGEGQGAKRDVSPPLEWYGVPEGTKSLALVVEDIDEPQEKSTPIVPWTHWVLVNIPPDVRRIPEGFSGKEEDLGGEYARIKEGHNDWKVPGYRGPIPTHHGHRIRFRLFALDDEMHLGNKVTKEKLLDAIQGHVLEEAELVAIY